jgi:hypothetical protein
LSQTAEGFYGVVLTSSKGTRLQKGEVKGCILLQHAKANGKGEYTSKFGQHLVIRKEETKRTLQSSVLSLCDDLLISTVDMVMRASTVNKIRREYRIEGPEAVPGLDE